jgi:CheY-like chemotaxis protein
MKKKILLIDDNLDEARTFSQALNELDLPTDFKYLGSGLEALPQLVKKDGYLPDIIFLDIKMPMTNGWECLRELKQLAESRGIILIVYSSSDIENEGMIASDIGATAFMRLPSSFAALKARLSGIFRSMFSLPA